MPKKATVEEVEEAKALLRKGLTLTAISDRLGRTKSWVAKQKKAIDPPKPEPVKAAIKSVAATVYERDSARKKRAWRVIILKRLGVPTPRADELWARVHDNLRFTSGGALESIKSRMREDGAEAHQAPEYVDSYLASL